MNDIAGRFLLTFDEAEEDPERDPCQDACEGRCCRFRGEVVARLLQGVNEDRDRPVYVPG